MQVLLEQFNSQHFSFHEHPVLVIENFWSAEERLMFLGAMEGADWTTLNRMPHLQETFPNCGNWQKAEIARAEAAVFLDRLDLTCIKTYMESFPNIIGRHINFNYYSYGAGDCLLTHDDTSQAGPAGQSIPSPLRRLALVTYLHDEWHPDWGGELIIYRAVRGPEGRSELTISHCIAPTPGSLVLFTVPRFHRVSRIDPVSGGQRRLSIAGWFMTRQGQRMDD